jgi:hypothetical protein
VHLFAIADDGTQPAALTAKAAPDATAVTGQSATLTLATSTGGATGAPRTARVQWGDASTTADTTATTAPDGTTTVTGTHTWTAPGEYPVHVTVSDGSTSSTVTMAVTVRDGAQQTIAAHEGSGVAAGRSVSIGGSGFRPGERVAILLDTPVAAKRTLTADRNGRISTAIVVPRRTAAGTYAITATGAKSGVPATATVTVPDTTLVAPQITPTLVLSSTTGTPGEVVNASGTGYRPNQLVDLVLTGGSGSERLTSARANGDGVFSTSFVVPTLGSGPHSITTTNAASAGVSPARAPFAATTTPHGTTR